MMGGWGCPLWCPQLTWYSRSETAMRRRASARVGALSGRWGARARCATERLRGQPANCDVTHARPSGRPRALAAPQACTYDARDAGSILGEPEAPPQHPPTRPAAWRSWGRSTCSRRRPRAPRSPRVPPPPQARGCAASAACPSRGGSLGVCVCVCVCVLRRGGRRGGGYRQEGSEVRAGRSRSR
jgi:hypothetical protein